MVSFTGVIIISKLVFSFSESGILTTKLSILFCKTKKHMVSIAFSSPTSLSDLNTAVPIFSEFLVPDIGDEPDFISLSLVFFEDWLLFELATLPKIAYGWQ